MDYLIKREIITNISFIEPLNNISWEDCKLSFKWDITNSIELNIAGKGDWKKIVYSNDKEESLLRTIDKLSFYLQSHIELGWNIGVYESGTGCTRLIDYIMHKENKNVGESVDNINKENILDWLSSQFSREDNWAIRWIRRGINANSSYESFYFFILACEVMAGDVNKYPKCRKGHDVKEGICKHTVDPRLMTNHEELKKILGEEVHKMIYTKGLRTDLFHGRYRKENECADILKLLYPKLINFLSNKYNIEIKEPKIPNRKLNYRGGIIKLFFNTNFKYEPIPRDSPSIKELKEWWNENCSLIKEPQPPKYIRHTKKIEK